MKHLLKRGLFGAAAVAIPVTAALALPMAANAAPVASAIHVVTDCTKATGAAAQYPQYPNGCSFAFYDGNGQSHTFTNYEYLDVVMPSGHETEVFVGNTADSRVPNNTGKVVTYNSKHNPNTSGQTALSFVSGKTTTHWRMTIQRDGDWDLIANFSK
jgi:hypothetical protein